MEKTDHQRRMEDLAEDQLEEARRAADASAEAAHHARIQAEVAEKQAEFQRNVMILEAADDEERSSFFMDYRKNEFDANLKKAYFSVVESVFKEIQDTKFIETLNQAKKTSQRLQSLRVAVAEAEKNFSDSQTKYYAVIGFAAIAAYILYDSISMAFHGFNPFGFWSVLSAIYAVFAFRYHKAWMTDGKNTCESTVKSAISEEVKCDVQLKQFITDINLLWTNNSESEIMNAYIKLSDPRAFTRIAAEHINKVQKDFPATCRVYVYDELLNDSNSESWSNHEVTPNEIINGWKDYHACFIKGKLLKDYILSEWTDEVMPGIEVIS
jgi:hypothetical protein